MRLLADAKINVLGLCGWTDTRGKYGMLQFVTEDAAAARKLLRKAKFKYDMVDVVCVEMAHKPGALAGVTEKLAGAGINVEYAYVTAGAKSKALAVFRVQSPAKALRALA